MTLSISMACNKTPSIITRPEAKLLFCYAQTSMDSERAAQVRSLLRENIDIDWDYLLRTALQHGLMPLLYWHLNATSPEAVPEAILDQLRDHFHNNTQRNLLLTRELLKLLNLFETHQIPAISFKGPVLAASVYGNLALRQFIDLDILVQKQDVPKAKELLISWGYQPQFQLTRAQEAAFLQSQYEHLFERHDGMVMVGLHWKFTPKYFSFPLDLERLWRRLEQTSLGGTMILTLSPEDLLLILCVHGSKHLWEQLGMICDIAELIKVRKGIDWKKVLEQASRLGSRRMLFLGLFLAHDLLGTVLPETVLQRVQADPVVKLLAAQVSKHMFQKTQKTNNSPLPEVLESCLFHLRAKERLRDKISYCFRLAITPTTRDWAMLPLPPSLSFLYYLIRPFRLIGKYGLIGLSPLKRRCRSVLQYFANRSQNDI